jgi:hypothetical protein
MAGPLQSIMNLFQPTGGAKIDTPPPNNPSNVAKPGEPLPGVSPDNHLVPNNPNPDPNVGKEVNPLDALKDIWDTPANTKPAETVADMFKNLDVKKLQEQAATVDFRGVVTPELLAKVHAGGQDGTQAMLEVMNAMAQKVYAHSALASTKITEQALTKADKIINDRMPGMIKSNVASESLRASDPMLNHPAMAPIVGALQAQFIQKNPNATAAEIQSQVSDAMKAMGAALNPKKAAASDDGTAKEMDWGSFLDV